MSGKLSMAVNHLSVFQGEDAVRPKINELAVDDDLNIYVWKICDVTPGEDDVTAYDIEGRLLIAVSKSKNIQKYLEELEASGIFTSSASFVNNRKINRFYFDAENGVVRIDPDRVFDPLYRYYAIRSINQNSVGGYDYITGVTGSTLDRDQTITSSLVNMDLKDSESGDGNQVSVPQTGGLIGEVSSGSAYVVEFYDESLNLVNIETFQAIAVRTADKDLCPDTAVTDMIVTSNQQYDNETVFLYQGQDVDSLQLATSLKYADGRQRDVTNEEINGGRLSISGLDNIDTTTLTSGDNTQTLTVAYQMVRSNASFASNAAYNTPTGATISPSSLTIKKDIKVRIVSDVVNDLVSLIPVGYIVLEKHDGIQENKIKMKYFGLYSNGVVNDITSIVRYAGTGLVDTNFNNAQSITVQVPYGNAGLYKNFSFTVTAADVNNSAVTSRRVKIGGNTDRILTYDTTKNGGGVYSGQFTRFSAYLSETRDEVVSATNLLSLAEVQYGTIAPTHIRIRDAIDPTYLYTDIVDPNDGVFYRQDEEHPLYEDRPLVIEFFHIETDGNGIALSTFATGALTHYARPAVS